ncbi:NHL repeat-containing protein [Nonomuraea sp. B10E15]|uniref:Vgb family protein n=1 Tax=Nonomuraea sp. B10E15 TaxID=3153560 RepID=UPI00325CB8D8
MRVPGGARANVVRRLLGVVLLALTVGCAGETSRTPPASPLASSGAASAAIHTGFSAPTGLAFAPDGTLYVSNWSGGTVERVTPDGARSTFAEVSAPAGLALDTKGNLYVASYSGDTVYRISPAGRRQEFATGFHTPTGIGFDSRGNLLVCNRASNEIMRVAPDGTVSRVAGGLSTPVGVAEDARGTIFVANYTGGTLSRIGRDGRVTTHSDDFDGLGVGLVVGRDNRLYATDRAAGAIKRVDQDGRAVAVMSGLGSPVALGVNAAGTIYTATWDDGALYQVPA